MRADIKGGISVRGNTPLRPVSFVTFLSGKEKYNVNYKQKLMGKRFTSQSLRDSSPLRGAKKPTPHMETHKQKNTPPEKISGGCFKISAMFPQRPE